MTHQSPSPLCEVDKSRLADLPRSAGVGNRTGRSQATVQVGYETTRSEDSTTELAGKDTTVYHTVSNLYSKEAVVITNALYWGHPFYTICHK